MNTITRRSFVKQSVAAGSLVALSSCATLPSSRKPKVRYVSPNSKMNVAFIGAGGKAKEHVDFFAAKENLVALCDVDDARAEETYLKYPDVPRFKDFRVMLDKMDKEIDAVVVTTPDHTHFVATMAAMERGIHVFTEKPLVRNIWQARTLVKAAEYYNVVTIMGNQGHATEGIRYVKEWYDAGVLGEVKEVLAWFDGPTIEGKYVKRPPSYPFPTAPVPDTLDWDLWQGPVVNGTPYHPDMVPLRWRGYFEYGCAELGDWACHTLDAPNWALDLGAPVSTELLQHETMFPTRYAPDKSIVKFEFAEKNGRAPVTLTWHDGGLQPAIRPEWGIETLEANGMIMIGSKATLMTGGRPDSPRLIPAEDWADFRKNVPAKTIPRIKGGHRQEWIDVIKGDLPKVGSDFAYGAKLTEMSLVGVLAQRFGGKIEYDEENMKITNRPELNQYIKDPVRKGWEAGDFLWS